MSLTIVPVVFLVLMVVLAHPTKDKIGAVTETQPKSAFSLSYKHKDITSQEEDRLTIYTYIRQKFSKIKDEDAKRISDGLIEYGKKFDLDPKFAAAVIARESGFRKDAVSITGAKGLGQIKDFNHKSLNIKNPFKIEENVSGTVEYLQKMIGKWKTQAPKKTPEGAEGKSKIELALASYYKGFTGVKTTGVDKKTENYVDDIIAYYKDIVNHAKK